MQVAVFANLKYQITNISIILSSARSCLSLPISGLISLPQILYAHLVIFLFFSSFLYSTTHLTEQTVISRCTDAEIVSGDVFRTNRPLYCWPALSESVSTVRISLLAHFSCSVWLILLSCYKTANLMLISIERKTVRSEQPSKTYNYAKAFLLKVKVLEQNHRLGAHVLSAISLVSELAVFPITGDWK